MKIVYFPIRGRAEPLRLICEYTHISYENICPDNFNSLKSKRGTTDCPFGQLPLLIDGDIIIPQYGAIIRHLGRKFHLYGKSEIDRSMVDVVLCAIDDIYVKYLKLIYQENLSDGAKSTFYDEVVDVSSSSPTCLLNLANILESHDFVACDEVTIADFGFFYILDLLLRLFLDEMRINYPDLCLYHSRFANMPELKGYLSDRQYVNVNANKLG